MKAYMQETTAANSPFRECSFHDPLSARDVGIRLNGYVWKLYGAVGRDYAETVATASVTIDGVQSRGLQPRFSPSF